MINLRKVHINRYIQPLKEGGSLPGLVEADDQFKYVIKFKGAGQGYKALVAELIGGLIAKCIGLNMPEMVIAELDESFGRTEPDQEIQDLLKASEGINLGIHFLKGAMTFDPSVNSIDEETASKILWLDAFILNVDRTTKNTNLLKWKNETWLIDHGASLYFHHNWDSWEKYIDKPFMNLKDHVLFEHFPLMKDVDEICKEKLSESVVNEIVEQIPDEWLENDGDLLTSQSKKETYKTFLIQRLNNSKNFINQFIQ